MFTCTCAVSVRNIKVYSKEPSSFCFTVDAISLALRVHNKTDFSEGGTVRAGASVSAPTRSELLPYCNCKHVQKTSQQQLQMDFMLFTSTKTFTRVHGTRGYGHFACRSRSRSCEPAVRSGVH